MSSLAINATIQESSHNPQTPVTSSPAYPESPDGLKNFLEDIFQALKSSDNANVSSYLSNIAVPNDADWFTRIFGSVEGSRLDAKYQELLPNLAGDFERKLRSALKDGRTDIKVTVLRKSGGSATAAPIMDAAREPLALYIATGSSPRQQYALFIGNFFYVQGVFRYVDAAVLQALSTAPSPRIRLGGTVAGDELIHEVDPVYPEDAKAAHLAGTVVLQAIISTAGSIEELNVISGDPILAVAATTAVRQWQYRQTLLNGVPAEVDTTISVTFRLR